MSEPRVFVDRMSEREGRDTLRAAILATSFGAEIVEEFVTSEGREADIIVAGSASRALRFLKETERAVIIVPTFNKVESTAASALANRNPERVFAPEFSRFVITYLKLIHDKAVEGEGNANPARG